MDPARPFPWLDRGAVARALAVVADREGDDAEVYCERLAVVALAEGEGTPALEVRAEQGFAVRLGRGDRSFLASRDELTTAAFADALRQVARVQPRALPEPELAAPPILVEMDLVERMRGFVRAVHAALRQRHVAFPLRLALRCERREVAVVGPRLAPDPECEVSFAVRAELPWGRHGLLAPDLDATTADRLAAALATRFRAREAPPLAASSARVLVLGPAAAAVLVHEAIGHALEADLMPADGRLARGTVLAPPNLSVLDDPQSAPAPLRRQADDEGTPVLRRFLLREGVVDQPLADRRRAARASDLLPGAGWRGSRHFPPLPRLRHLEVLAGETSEADLVSGPDVVYAPLADRGLLDSAQGTFELGLPLAWQLRDGSRTGLCGPLRLRAPLASLLDRLEAIGSERETTGGYCAKAGQRLATWATVPALRLAGVDLWTP